VLFGFAAINVGALVWFSQGTAVDVDELLARAIESLKQAQSLLRWILDKHERFLLRADAGALFNELTATD
tara:strand:- start:548 stop:757 length:210 start_codon:yes stop_codon:yes gene_type:complete